MTNISHFDLILKIKSLLPNNITFNIKHNNINNRNFINISWVNGLTINEVNTIINSISYTEKYNPNYIVMSRNTIDINEHIDKKWNGCVVDSNEFLKEFSFNSDEIEIIELEWNNNLQVACISDYCTIKYKDIKTDKILKSKKNFTVVEKKIALEEAKSNTSVEKVIDKKTGLDIKIIPYTEKSIVVVGDDTKVVKDKLKELGGSWNGGLTDKVTNEKFGGWIFPKSKEEPLLGYIKKWTT